MEAQKIKNREGVLAAAGAAFDEILGAYDALGPAVDGSIASSLEVNFDDGSAIKITVDVGVFEKQE